MNVISNQLYPGMYLNTFAFGEVVVKKIYTHADTGETCLDCKSMQGDNLHLSQRYALKLLNK